MTDTDDLYGTDIALTPQGDLAVTPSGALGVTDGADTCVQALVLFIRASPGDLPLHPTYGTQINARLVGAKSNFDAIRALALGDLRQLLENDTRFLGATPVDVVPVQAPHGVGAAVRVTVQLAAGEELAVADLASGSIESVNDAPVDGDVDPALDFDPLLFFDEDDDESIQLQDLDEQAEQAEDLQATTDDTQDN